MPKAMEQALEKEAAAKNLRGKAAKSYIFGTMQNAGKLKAQKGGTAAQRPAFGGGRMPPDRGGNQDGES